MSLIFKMWIDVFYWFYRIKCKSKSLVRRIIDTSVLLEQQNLEIVRIRRRAASFEDPEYFIWYYCILCFVLSFCTVSITPVFGNKPWTIAGMLRWPGGECHMGRVLLSLRSFKILWLPIVRSGMPQIPWQILCLQPLLWDVMMMHATNVCVTSDVSKKRYIRVFLCI